MTGEQVDRLTAQELGDNVAIADSAFLGPESPEVTTPAIDVTAGLASGLVVAVSRHFPGLHLCDFPESR